MIEEDGKELILYDFPNFINKNEEIGNNLDDFEILKILDDSQYSQVFKVKSKINFKIYAMKRISLTLIQENELFSEIEFFKEADHPYIIKYFKSFYDHDYIYIIMEFMDNYDLEKYNDLSLNFKVEIPEEKIFQMSYKCLSVLYYIHKENKKRQIKLKQIFMDDNFNIKINILSLSSIINYNKESRDIHVLGNSLNQLYHNNNSNYNEIIKTSLYSFLEFIASDKNAKIETGATRAKELFIKFSVKNNSLKAIFKCLNSYKNIGNYFLDKNVSDFIYEDKNNKNKSFSKQVLNIITKLNAKKINEEELDSSFYEFRKILVKKGFGVKENIEIPPEAILPYILIKLNTELNEVVLMKNREYETKQKSDDTKIFKDLNRKKFLLKEKEADGEKIFAEIFNSYNERISSLISRNFLSYIKSFYKCHECGQAIIQFSWVNYLWISVDKYNPENNIFHNYDGSFISCSQSVTKECGKCQKNTKHYEYNYFYKGAKNLIIILDRGKNYKNQILIEFKDNIKLKDGYNNKDVEYKLKGIISKLSNSDDYIYNLIDSNNTFLNQINSETKQMAVILFYELNNGSLIDIQPPLKPKTQFGPITPLYHNNCLSLQKANSDFINYNTNTNNINNNTYIPNNPTINNNKNLEYKSQRNQIWMALI